MWGDPSENQDMQIALPKHCRLCGSEELRFRTSLKGELQVFRCPTCKADMLTGTVQFPQAAVVTADSAPASDLYGGFSAGQRSAQYWEDYVGCAGQRLAWQKEIAFPNRPFSELAFLDIGCGGGHFMAAAKRLGFQRAVGTEVDRAAVEQARAKGLEAHAGEWPVAEVARERFDFISLMHVLEHVPKPADFLSHCLGCLAPGGLLAIDVPDQGSLPALFKRVLHKCGRRPKDYGYVQPPWHLSGFRLQSFDWFAGQQRLKYLWRRRTSPLDRTVFPHTDYYWSGRFRWNRRVYTVSRLAGQGGYLTIGLRRV